MSVVTGKVFEKNIVVAADSILVRDYTKQVGKSFSKLEYINDMIIGGVGSAEELSLIFRFSQTHKPETATEKDVLAFVLEFAKWKGLYSDTKINNYYLLAYGGHLFSIEQMFVTEIHNYDAIGAGEDYARAALYLGYTPQEAVDVACKLSCYVSEPIIAYEMKRECK